MSKQRQVGRREFIKKSAMAFAATAAASRLGTGQTAQAAPGVPELPGVTWDKAPCRFCGTGCHVQVGVKAGRVVAIAGDRKAAVNKGLCCVKGYHVGLAMYGADRLTKPLLRKEGKLQPVSWDEALEAIVDRIAKKPEGFAIYGSGSTVALRGSP